PGTFRKGTGVFSRCGCGETWGPRRKDPAPWALSVRWDRRVRENLIAMSMRAHVETADTVSLVCALLVRFPELASIRSGPVDRTLRLTFAIRQRLDRSAQTALVEALEEHVDSFLALGKEEPGVLRVECESDRALTFMHVTRDLESFSKEELEL